jgi:uncharacterized protein YcbK (DUF882 family)
VRWSELACHTKPNPTPYPLDLRDTELPTLLATFEAIRWAVGGPLRILSCYRTAAYNAAIGGAAQSQHVLGRAMDLATPATMSLLVFHALILELASRAGATIGAIGLYDWGCHVDTRPRKDGRLVQWDLRTPNPMVG